MRTFTVRCALGVASSARLLAVVGLAWLGHGALTPPTIAVQPQPAVPVLGAPAVFTLMAEGSPPWSFQWQRNGADLPGATSEALILPHVRHADAGDYSAVVRNAAGSAASAAARLAVRPPQAGDVDGFFDPGVSLDGPVHCLAVQPDGKVLIGGEFTSVAGAVRHGVARLNADGSTDYTFMNGLTGADGTVYALALQPDRKVLIGGTFATVHGQPRGGVARLNPDGTLDPAFLGGLGGVDGAVYALALQPDGRVAIGGDFASVNGVSRNYLARLNADGSLDTGFLAGLAGPDNSVDCLVAQPDGKLLLGGWFIRVHGQGRSRVARLQPDGGLDASFMDGLTGANDGVESIALQPDGKILVGGMFTRIHGQGRNRLARLNADGTLDTAFLAGLTGADDWVWSVALEPGGKVLIGGEFSRVNGLGRSRLARLTSTGALDTGFQNGLEGADDSVHVVAASPGGGVLAGGWFYRVNAVETHCIARLLADGALDSTFQNGLSGFDGSVFALAPQADGTIFAAGYFWTVAGEARGGLARLNPNGSLDTSFLDGLGGADDTIDALATQPDGKVLAGGVFTMFNGQARSYLARLNPDGSLDDGFLDGLDGPDDEVFAVAVQPDGRLVIAGYFMSVNGVPRGGVARLHADGSLDTTFLNGLEGADNVVYTLALQPDGKVLLGGYFANVNGQPRSGLARLNANGSLDTGFQNGLEGADDAVYFLALQLDGKVLIGGDFSTVNGLARGRVARLNRDGSLDKTFLGALAGADDSVFAVASQADGRVLVGGMFTTFNGEARRYMVRLTSTGALDPSFQDGLPGADNPVYAVAVAADGKLLLGGDFASVNGVPSGRVASLWSEAPDVDLPPSIAVEPQPVAARPGDTVTFAVTAYGALPLSYRWQRNQADLPGATDASLTLANVQAAAAGAYRVIVSNADGTVTSAQAALTVGGPAAPALELVRSAGVLRLQWTGVVGQAYRVQSSTDLAQWSEVAALTANQTAVGYDLPATGPAQLFLRVLAP